MAFGKHPSTDLWTERKGREMEMINKMTFTILTRLRKLKETEGLRDKRNHRKQGR